LRNGPIHRVEEINFDKIDEEMIFRASKFTNGAARPSQTDAQFFRNILTHKNFKDAGKQLKEQFAKFARSIATVHRSPDFLDAYVNCRLIPLNKNPGVRSIEIGETFRVRRIIGKAVSWVHKSDFQEAGSSWSPSSLYGVKKRS
jgi:hypothetical protein